MIYPRLNGKTLVLVAAMALNFSLVAVSSALQAASIYTSPYIITTLAGGTTYGSSNGTGTAALFFGPSSTAVRQ